MACSAFWATLPLMLPLKPWASVGRYSTVFPFRETLDEVGQLYRKKPIPTSWSSSGRIWSFKDYCIILYFLGLEKVVSRVSVYEVKKGAPPV